MVGNWAHELAAAQRAGLVDRVEIQESWTYSPCLCSPPFREIRSLYRRRQEVGSKTPEGKAIKLPMNSVYGKLAQSVGARPFANVIYAGLITAGTRTMVLDSVASHPKGAEAVVMVATDAVFFTEPHPHLPVSKELGDWELVKRSNMCILKPGVYWDDDAREKIRTRSTPLFKARGINAKAFAPQLERLDDEFARMRDTVARGDLYPWPRVSYRTDFAMISAKQALQRRRWHNAGRVSSAKVVQSSDPRTKRDGLYYDPRLGVLRTRPYAEVEELESCPYLRMEERRELADLLWDAEGRIGKERIRMEREDFDTPDGPAGAIFYGQLGTGQWA